MRDLCCRRSLVGVQYIDYGGLSDHGIGPDRPRVALALQTPVNE